MSVQHHTNWTTTSATSGEQQERRAKWGTSGVVRSGVVSGRRGVDDKGWVGCIVVRVGSGGVQC